MELKLYIGLEERRKECSGVFSLGYWTCRSVYGLLDLLDTSNLIGNNIGQGTGTDGVGEANGVKKTTGVSSTS
jgi:hypothetical protein